MVTTRSQSLRLPRASYNKLQDAWGDRSERKGLSPLVPQGRQQGPRFQRSLSLRPRREKRPPEASGGLPEGGDSPPPDGAAGNPGDTEQLIQGKARGRQRMHQYKKQVDHALRRTWGSFVANLPGVTLSRSAPPGPAQDSAS
ncbi:uncharacterized protein C11orf86 homolog [Antechinus flavipes]|uniref:uncharacterized protein C11orf86 homolog n=1 Tax=Antechinus flavipes TaxID=38775 RepID=UPI0022358A5A|nr:uncharacterized protein C11orf86 homolog [Antechinus flavipes]